MSLLTQRTLRVFAVLEDYRGGSADILDALLPLFEPFIADRTEGFLEPAELAQAVSDTYRWNITADIIEELIPRFQARGWVKSCDATQNGATYKIVYQEPTEGPVAPATTQIVQDLDLIAGQFHNFIRKISPLTAVDMTTDELSELLIEWLVSIDAYTEDVLRQRVTQPTEEGGTLGLAVHLPDDGRLSSEGRYLCARFVKHLWETNSPHITGLCKIASVGLLTEVIQDFRKPIGSVGRTNLNVYLDAPLALDLLGVSGKAAANNIRPIFEQLRAIGANLRIFRVSVTELQKALHAVLGRQPSDRTGPTAEAIRRNEASEAFVREVLRSPDDALGNYHVQIVDRSLDQFPHQHDHFTKEQYEELFSRINWHFDVAPREHDASVIALILRMRGNTRSSDLFMTGHVLVTRNTLLSQLSRRFSRENQLIAASHVGPAVHQRQLATVVWLRTGLWNEAEEVPKRYVLAACERVLELKKNVIDKVRSEARNLTPEKAEQLELLLTQDRSAQVLMDKTLNVPQVIGPSNIEALLDNMRRSIAADIQEEASRQIEATKKEASAKVRSAHGRRREAEERASEMEASLKSRNEEDERLVRKFLIEVNANVRVRRNIVSAVVAIVLMLFALVPWIFNVLPTYAKFIIAPVCIMLALFLAHQQIWDRVTGLSQLLDRWDNSILQRLADRRGMTDKVAKFSLVKSNHRYELPQPDQRQSMVPMNHGDNGSLE